MYYGTTMVFQIQNAPFEAPKTQNCIEGKIWDFKFILNHRMIHEKII